MAIPANILVVGVGNLLLSDDGVGVHAIRALQEEPIPGVSLVEIGTAILHGLSFLEKAERVLIIDAAKGGRAPGTLYLFEPGDTSGPPQSLLSVHALGLREAARLLPPEIPRPAFTVLGVEPASLDLGLELSPALRAALPSVVALARQTIETWRQEEPSAVFAGGESMRSDAQVSSIPVCH